MPAAMIKSTFYQDLDAEVPKSTDPGRRAVAHGYGAHHELQCLSMDSC